MVRKPYSIVFLWGIVCVIAGLVGLLGCFSSATAGWEVGANLTLAIPQGEFDEFSDAGTGLELKGMYRLGNLPVLSLKADLGFITYKYGQYLERNYLVETRTQSIRLTAGPQVSLRHRRLEAYLSPMVGMYYFYTQDDIMWTFLTRTRNSTWEPGWHVSGGLLIDIARMPSRSFDLALDIGGSWHSVRGGFEGDVVDAEGTIISITRDVTELCLHAGVVFFLR